ncbi:MAG: hypothetical protein MI924_29565 [Chloroflexales bacterium]|nr:hypothetical protein [Chloroflexales bacterium]
MQRQPIIAYWLTGLIIVLTVAAALSGLLWPGIYNDPAPVLPQAYGQDMVTLVVGVPLLVIATVFAVRGSLRGRLIWLGALGYILYTYASFAFGAVYNNLFLLYVALFSLSLFAMMLGMMSLDVGQIGDMFAPDTPVRPLAGYFGLVGFLVGLMWLSEIVLALMTGTLPPTLVESQVHTLFIQVLDLAVVVPLSLLAAVLLWQRRPWGYTLASVLLVKAATLGLAVLAMIVFMAQAGLAVNWGVVALFLGITLAPIVLAVPFLRSLHENEQPPALRPQSVYLWRR